MKKCAQERMVLKTSRVHFQQSCHYYAACQVDGQTSYNWHVVFVVPWIWFSSLFLLAWLVGPLLWG